MNITKNHALPGARISINSRWRPIVGAAVCVALLSACARPSPPPYDDGGAKVTTVDPCASGLSCDRVVRAVFSGSTCSIQFPYGDAYIGKGRLATWHLGDVGRPVEFDPVYGIQIDNNLGDFTTPTLDAKKTTFSWIANDKASTGFRHKYSIHVIWMKPGTDGIACTVFDPIIVNSF